MASASKRLAIVREIVNFPVPAIPFSQKMDLEFKFCAHLIIWSRSSTWVFDKQVGLYSSARELKEAPTATGSRLSTIFWLILSRIVLR